MKVVIAILALVLGAGAVAAQANPDANAMPAWDRSGPVIFLRPPPPQPVPEERVQQQMGAGCNNTAIRFGDTAALRAAAPPVGWANQTRRAASAAAFLDDAEYADRLLSDAENEAEDDTGHLHSLRVLTAVQSGHTSRARMLLSARDTVDFPDAVQADLAFWAVLLDAPNATTADWRDRLLGDLEVAFEADPSSFSIRAWRVIGWLEAQPWLASANCPALIGSFADRLLDLSDAGACPLLVGHLDFAMARHFQSRTSIEPSDGRMIWRQFSTGLLAHITRESATRDAMIAALLASSGGGGCSGLMASELSRLASLQ